MQGLLRYEVDLTSEQVGQLVFELVDGKPEVATRGEQVEQVHVAVRAGVAARLRAEQSELGKPVTLAELVEASGVDVLHTDLIATGVTHRP
jgi:hypothetical protein